MIVLPVTWWLTEPDANINWVYGLGTRQRRLPQWLYLVLLIIAFSLVLYLPPHLALSYFPFSVTSS